MRVVQSGQDVAFKADGQMALDRIRDCFKSSARCLFSCVSSRSPSSRLRFRPSTLSSLWEVGTAIDVVVWCVLGSIPIPFFFSRFAWPCYYHCPRSFGFWSRCADQNSYTFWDDYLGNSYPKYGNCCGLGEYSPASSLLPYVKRENMVLYFSLEVWFPYFNLYLSCSSLHKSWHWKMLGNPVLHTQIVSKQSPFIEMRPLLNVMKPTYVVYVFYDLCANVPSLVTWVAGNWRVQ